MSKLTIHFQRIPDWFGAFVDRCQGRLGYVVGVDVFPELAGVKVLGRTYLPDGESGALVDRGASGADEWIERFAPVYVDNAHVDKWIGPNEYVLWDSSAVDRFNAFHVRFIERMSGLGHGVVCGQINTGWPRLRLFDDPPPYPEALAPTLAALWAHGGIFSLHEYGPGDMRSGVGAHCLRYRNTRAALRVAGIQNIPDFFISETGIDVPDPAFPLDHGHRGWREFADWPDYFDQLKWYSGELDQDPYVLGASIFTVADDWLTFRLDREQAFPLADFIAVDAPPPPPPERARGLDVCRYQGDINWEMLKSAGYTFAMIRVSGPNNDRTDVEVDPRFEANYAGAESVGVLRGGYHGLVPGFDGQAKLFVDAVGGRPLELGYWSDLENMALTDNKCAAHLEAVDQRIAGALGLPVERHTGVYTSPGFMAGRDGSWAEGRRLWLASWTFDLELEPTVPAPWAEWEFWQWTNQGTDVPGVPSRTCLDVYDGTVDQLRDEYGNGGEPMDVKVFGFDDQGNMEEKTWQWAVDRYGVRLVEADPPDGATVYRLTELRQKVGPCGLMVHVQDEEGNPLERIAVIQGWANPDKALPADAAPRLSETVWAQPDGKPNQGTGGMTNSEGDHGWGWGGGEQYDPTGSWDPDKVEGAHWYWVMPGDHEWYSDVTLGFGWLLGTDHDHLDVTFTRTTAENGNGGNGEDPDLEAVVAQLKRIADAAEHMAAHWPYK